MALDVASLDDTLILPDILSDEEIKGINKRNVEKLLNYIRPILARYATAISLIKDGEEAFRRSGRQLGASDFIRRHKKNRLIREHHLLIEYNQKLLARSRQLEERKSPKGY